jgi:hypothetical protein
VTRRLAARYVPNGPPAVFDARMAFLIVMTDGAYRRAASSV